MHAIPAGVAAAIDRAMHKDPAQRPQTMHAFADLLRAAAAPTAAPSPSSPPRWSMESLDSLARKSRNMLLAVGAGALMTVLLRPPPPCTPAAAETAVLPAPAPVSAVSARGAEAEPAPAQQVSPVEDASAMAVVLPEVTMPAAAASPPRSPGISHAGSRRALNKRLPEVQVCADRATGGLKSLSVAVHIDKTGRVSAQVVGAPDTILSRCIDAALRSTPVTAPSGPISFTHTFRLRPLPGTP